MLPERGSGGLQHSAGTVNKGYLLSPGVHAATQYTTWACAIIWKGHCLGKNHLRQGAYGWPWTLSPERGKAAPL